MRVSLCDFVLGKTFLNTMSKAQITKEKLGKLDNMKI